MKMKMLLAVYVGHLPFCDDATFGQSSLVDQCQAMDGENRTQSSYQCASDCLV